MKVIVLCVALLLCGCTEAQKKDIDKRMYDCRNYIPGGYGAFSCPICGASVFGNRCGTHDDWHKRHGE